MIKTADWVIDLGPEAGQEGGCVVAAGTPEDIVAHAERWRKQTMAGAKTKKGIATRSPLPPGEGRGEGSAPRSVTSKSGPRKGSPHPNPLPEGEGNPMRSYTGEMLAPVLAAGPLVKRAVFNFAAAEAVREGDREITDVGGEAKMPWEVNGRRWHTRERVGRTGDPCRWDGRILDEVVQRIQQSSDLFSETDWNSRTVVEISAAKKSEGWFFHAITGEEWLLKMKFRTARNVFQRDELIARLDLKPLNDMPDLPLYGTQPRTRVRNLRGPWQEIELRVHGYEEIDRPEFWKFLDEAVAGFGRFSERVEQQADILQPWKQLGRKWHFARSGFPVGKRVAVGGRGPGGTDRIAGRGGAARAVALEQQAGGAALRARAEGALGGGADEEARRRPRDAFRARRGRHARPPGRPGLRRPMGRPTARLRRAADEIRRREEVSPRRAGGVA